MAQLDVRDTGDGIAAGLLPTIFERFRQADTSSTRQHEGLGLGLSITKYIVDHLGGTITAASAGAGQGACFSVRLPFAGTKRADDARPGPPVTVPHERPVVPPAPAASRLAGLAVLVVDDHRDTVELIAFVLEREGATVRTAMAAREALAAWQAHPADVLVTDLSMPGMDGFAPARGAGGTAPTCRRLRSAGWRAPTIVSARCRPASRPIWPSPSNQRCWSRRSPGSMKGASAGQ